MLAGAEIAFEIENDLFVPYRKIIPISSKTAALLITFRCIESFTRGEKPQNDRTLSHELGISLYHLQTLLDILQNEGILTAISSNDKVIGYQPACSVDTITFSSVLKALDRSNELMASLQDSPPLRKIQNFLQQADYELENSQTNQPLYKSLST